MMEPGFRNTLTKAHAQVTDYLLKRGFNRTEEVFRQESKHLGPDGKPIYQLANLGPKKYQRAFGLLREWVENNLDIYKVCHGHPPSVSFADNSSSNCPSCCGPSSSILSWNLSNMPTLKMRRLSSETSVLTSSQYTRMISRPLVPLHSRSTSTRTP